MYGRTWNELPMVADVISTVEARALREDWSLLRGRGPLFEWRPCVPIDDGDNDDDDDDDDYVVREDEPFFEIQEKTTSI